MSHRNTKRKALGRGLGALIPGAGSATNGSVSREYFSCPIERIHPQPGQPRRRITRDGLSELVQSIRELGIIQPIIVRRRDSGEGFELIAGERRWRAAQLAGLKELPVFVKETSSVEAFEMALVENLQREDLNPIEEAEAFRRLIKEYKYTQAQVAKRVGRDRSTVANSLRLLGLPQEVRVMVIDESLTEGHARAILQASDQTKMKALAKLAANNNLSVRETERRARTQSTKNGASKRKTTSSAIPQVELLIRRLQKALGARVNLTDKKGRGKIEISYTSYAELDRILNKILR